MPTIAFVLLAVTVAFGQPPASDQFTLVEVAVTGARRVSHEAVLKGSGLAIGQTVTVAAAAAAANQLSATGLFKTVRYRYVTSGGRMTVTFEVEEVEGGVPVIFDNFVWFTDDELVAAVRADLPTFEGTAPDTRGVLDSIRQTLSALLGSRGLPGQVRYTPDVDLIGGRGLIRHLFTVAEPAPRLCALRFDGANGVQQRDLLTAIPGVVGQDYSSVLLNSLTSGTLQRVYRQRGFWRAAFAPPAVTIDGGCRGVNAVLTVTEGPVFTFERVEWSGNTALASTRLDSLLGLKRDAVANIQSIEDGLRAIGKAYRRQGYIVQKAAFVPELEDAVRRAVFTVTLVEGPQFRVGSVEFVGFDDRQLEDLKKKWRLQPGDVYDDDYGSEFLKSQFPPQQRPGGATPPPSIETRVDTQHLVVSLQVVRR